MGPCISIGFLQFFSIFIKKLYAFLMIILQILNEQPDLAIIDPAYLCKKGRNIPHQLKDNIFQFFLIFTTIVYVNIQEQETCPE